MVCELGLDIEPGRCATGAVDEMRAVENRDAKASEASDSSPIATFRSFDTENLDVAIACVREQVSKLHDTVLNCPPESARAVLPWGSFAHDGRHSHSAIAFRRDPLLKSSS